MSNVICADSGVCTVAVGCPVAPLVSKRAGDNVSAYLTNLSALAGSGCAVAAAALYVRFIVLTYSCVSTLNNCPLAPVVTVSRCHNVVTYVTDLCILAISLGVRCALTTLGMSAIVLTYSCVSAVCNCPVAPVVSDCIKLIGYVGVAAVCTLTGVSCITACKAGRIGNYYEIIMAESINLIANVGVTTVCTLTNVGGVSTIKTGRIGNYCKIVVIGSFFNYIATVAADYVYTALNGFCA